MKIYRYKGINSKKKLFIEDILVKDEREFKDVLKSTDKKIIKIIKIKNFKKLKDSDLKNFYQNTSRLLKAGIPIKKAIEFQSNSSEKIDLKVKYKRVFNRLNMGEDILKILKEEEMINEAELLIAYVSTTIGQVSEGFLKIAQLKENKQKFKKEIQGALSYPLFIMVISTIIIILIFALIVPNFISIYESSEEELPIITKIILNIYNFGSKYVYLILISLGLVLKIGYNSIKKNDILLKTPILKYFFIEKSIINLLENLALLLKSGIAIDKSVDIVLSSLENRFIYRKFLVLKKIKKGRDLSDVLTEVKEFSILELNMIKVGEESGEVASMLEEIYTFKQENLDARLRICLNLAEPMLLLMIGVIISFFVIGLYLPILNMSNIIKI